MWQMALKRVSVTDMVLRIVLIVPALVAAWTKNMSLAIRVYAFSRCYARLKYIIFGITWLFATLLCNGKYQYGNFIVNFMYVHTCFVYNQPIVVDLMYIDGVGKIMSVVAFFGRLTKSIT